MKLFRNKRREQLTKNKIVNYIKYAIGEILLVVVGILIAVSINNLNEEKKQERALSNILAVLAEDMKKDTLEAGEILDHYRTRKPLFENILNDSLTRAETIACGPCPFLLVSRKLMTIETRGYEQLKNFNNLAADNEDTLVVQIIHYYTQVLESFEAIQGNIERDVEKNLAHWSTNYFWFSDLMKGKPSEAYYDYVINNPEYKNYMALHYVLLYNNHAPLMRNFKRNTSAMLSEITKKLAD